MTSKWEQNHPRGGGGLMFFFVFCFFFGGGGNWRELYNNDLTYKRNCTYTLYFLRDSFYFLLFSFGAFSHRMYSYLSNQMKMAYFLKGVVIWRLFSKKNINVFFNTKPHQLFKDVKVLNFCLIIFNVWNETETNKAPMY